MTTGALLRAFRRIVIRLGRWFAKRLTERGIDWLIGAMAKRIGAFRKALKRTTRSRARWRRWMAARIRARQHAIRWLTQNRKTLTRATLTALDVVTRKLPSAGNVENEKAWSKR
jgi:hypothetical protein